ncbi:MAG: hypothetical protein ACTTK1_01145 [Candidatus Cryptobacteroides sp.]
MKTNNYFATMACKVFALAATVMMMSTAFTACSKDDNHKSKSNANKYVDLGLSVKWGKCNLGASKANEYGDLYAWGETQPKKKYEWENYKFLLPGKSNEKYINKYTFEDDQKSGIWYKDDTFIGDGKKELEKEDDAATVKLGSPWRIPTPDEYQELIEKCTWTWTELNGTKGYEVKSNINGNTIFLPAAGYHNNRYSSEPIDQGVRGIYSTNSLQNSSYYLKCLFFISDRHDLSFCDRCIGNSIRPVHP